mmetsp:Transcript_14289/g.46630  ORF Transcript_14289/g.46630 Transcript_14289/m.46630 type:complete len:208 (+) Transcript_14289:452-1075(+)
MADVVQGALVVGHVREGRRELLVLSSSSRSNSRSRSRDREGGLLELLLLEEGVDDADDEGARAGVGFAVVVLLGEVQEARADEGLEAVGELPLGDEDLEAAQIEAPGEVSEGRSRHEARAHLRQPAFVQVGPRRERVPRHRQAHDGVSEVLLPLVALSLVAVVHGPQRDSVALDVHDFVLLVGQNLLQSSLRQLPHARQFLRRHWTV